MTSESVIHSPFGLVTLGMGWAESHGGYSVAEESVSFMATTEQARQTERRGQGKIYFSKTCPQWSASSNQAF